MFEVSLVSKFVSNPDNLITLHGFPGVLTTGKEPSLENWINKEYARSKYVIVSDTLDVERTWNNFIKEVSVLEKEYSKTKLYFWKYNDQIRKAKSKSEKALQVPYQDAAASLKNILNAIMPATCREVNKMIAVLSDLNFKKERFKFNEDDSCYDVSRHTVALMGGMYADRLREELRSVFEVALLQMTDYELDQLIEKNAVVYTA